MKRSSLYAISQVALTTSVVFFALSIYRFSDWNWRPVEEPFPGSGYAVSASFEITNLDKYRMEVIVPVKIDKNEMGMAEQPPIPCNVLLSLKGPKGFHIEQRITNLRHNGRYYFGKTDIYGADPVGLVPTGEYQLEITNLGSSGPLVDRGAMLRFTRFERPTESNIASTLVRGVGWYFLAIGLVSIIASWTHRE